MTAGKMETDVLIVGAGFAGAATAYHLSRSFSGSVVVVEGEPEPGLHASGLNASMVIQPSQSEPVRDLCIRSRSFYQEHADVTGFNQTGSLMLGSMSFLESLQDPKTFQSEIRSTAATCRHVPLLEGHMFEGALWTPSDGIMDIRRLLRFYIRAATERGVTFQCGQRVSQIRLKKRFEVLTTSGKITADRLVNAAGAWATPLGEASGATPLQLSIFKRHLFVLDSSQSINPKSPAVWNLEKAFYFRPYMGGLLLCVCDAEQVHRLDSNIDLEIRQCLAEILWKELPALHDTEQREAWCCFRVFTGDGLPLIGPDPSLPGFYWVAGLGGYGMSASWEIGRLAALCIADNQAAPQFDPVRFWGI